MPSYVCTISFLPGNTGVKTDWSPAAPTKTTPGDNFAGGDVVHFTSSVASWKVGYTQSPFADDPVGAVRSFQGRAGQSEGSTLAGGRGHCAFNCALFDQTKNAWVGWGSAGGGQTDTPP